MLVQRRNRREHSRFRPSRSYPLLSPPDRIRGKIQPVNPSPSQQQAMQQEVASYRSARASQNCLSQLPNPFTPSSLLDFGQLRGLGATLKSSRLGMAVASPLSVPGHDAFLDLHRVDLGFCQYCSGL